MFDEATQAEPQNRIADWVLRGAVAFVFILFGLEKFPSGPNTEWVRFFDQVGVGQWFRYVTGFVEIAGGLLVAIPVTARAGLMVLAATMASACLIHIFVLHRPGNCVVPGALFLGLSAMWFSQRRRSG